MKVAMMCFLVLCLCQVLIHAEDRIVDVSSASPAGDDLNPQAQSLQTDSRKQNESSDETLAWSPESQLNYNIQTGDAGSTQPDLDMTGMISGIYVRRTVTTTVVNKIPTDAIKVKCQALKDNKLVRDFNFIPIYPLAEYRWKIRQLDYKPNIVKCFFLWGHWGANHLTYELYHDSGSARQDSRWLVDEVGLYGFMDHFGYVIVKRWISSKSHVG